MPPAGGSAADSLAVAMPRPAAERLPPALAALSPAALATAPATVTVANDHGTEAGSALRLLNSNRVCLAGAAIAGAGGAATALWLASGALDARVWQAVMLLLPCLLFAHIASRQMGRLALTRRIWLFMPVFALCVAALLPVCLLVLGGVQSLALLGGAGAVAGWYLMVEALLERHCPHRFGLVGDWPVLDLPSDRRSSFRHLLPGSSLDGISALVVADKLPHSLPFQGLLQRAALRGIETSSSTSFRERMLGRTPEAALDDDTGVILPAPTYLKIRRLLDVALALVLLLPFALLIGASAALIRLESPGPAIFRQTRVGRRRKPFTCYKLRTMRTDMAGTAFTGDDDPRITRLGRLLRKSRIDETPQIWNVLRGDMSWIGPRPEAIPLAAQYRLNIPHYSYRYLVPPGITGWAAVHQGNVGEVAAAREKLEYDFYYIRNLSAWMDLLVILKTVKTLLTGFGSR